MDLRKLSNRFWLILLVSCSQTPEQEMERISIALNSNMLPRTDFMSLNIEHNRLLIKNKLTNSVAVFDFATKELLATIYIPGRISHSEIQSASFLNTDTLLILFKNDPTLYLSDQYGHVYNYWPLADTILTHFSITTNPPFIHNKRLYISLIPNFDKLRENDKRKKWAVEYVVDLRNRTSHEILLSIPQQDTMQVGIRHAMATRTFANGTLNYLWGSGGDILQLHLDNENQKIITPDLKKILLKPFVENYTNNRWQMSYYYTNPVYDHMTYDKYKKQYYAFLLHSGEQYSHKYQRKFTIFVLDSAFEFVDKKAISGNELVFDQEFVTNEGLFLSTNNPFSEGTSSDTLHFEKIVF